ncbi:MAG: metallophosphoesterase [Nanoarchaeota archaeon]|nr:metallophosphoesterase [Nanoarchaeota archaeon]
MGDFLAIKKYVSEIDENIILSKDEEILLLKNLEILYMNSIKLSYLNQDICELLTSLPNINSKDIISKFKEINFEDLIVMAKDISTPRKLKIYYQFVDFIFQEFELKRKSKLKVENESLEDENINLKLINNNTKNNEIDDLIFKKIESFNYEEDLAYKLSKYNVSCEFNYTKPSGKIGVKNFILYFNQRLKYFTELLSSRITLDNVVRINQLKELQETNTQVSLIGLINDFQVTKNGHHIISLEDKSGDVKCFINKDNQELIEKIKLLCLDEGIGILGKVGKGIIWTDDIIIPSPPNGRELKKIQDEEGYIVCTSDLHIGAHVFQDEAFSKFLDFLNCNTNNEKLNEIAKKIKYLLIPGDLIEGIGIYPGQGKDARILSTEKQYHEVARWLSQVPKHIAMIIIPGNHDTDRLSEPQPPIPYEKAYAVYNLENTLMFSNPSIVTLYNQDSSGGFNCYSYHGASYFYYANEIQSLREKGGAKVPEEIVKFLLEKRHLAPSHGSTLYIPDTQEDPLIIKKMPDFFLTGHTHKLSVANYKGCTIISGGCWVEMSDYQEKMGMFPDVGKCILVDINTRKPKIINFYTEEHKREEKIKNKK